jgi:hypothetical protein
MIVNREYIAAGTKADGYWLRCDRHCPVVAFECDVLASLLLHFATSVRRLSRMQVLSECDLAAMRRIYRQRHKR